MTNPEIPQPAVEIAAEKLWRLIWEDDDFKPFSEASKESREICLEGAEELLAAALPHLRVQETRASEADHEETWRALVEGEMRFRGYTDAEIEVASRVPSHTADCEYEHNTYSWICDDGDGKSVHPVADEYGEIADLIGRALEALPAPHPRPVVDREALERCITDALIGAMVTPGYSARIEADADDIAAAITPAILALLPTEEGEGHGQEGA